MSNAELVLTALLLHGLPTVDDRCQTCGADLATLEAGRGHVCEIAAAALGRSPEWCRVRLAQHWSSSGEQCECGSTLDDSPNGLWIHWADLLTPR
ncbi:hypothetical protein GCM10022237_39500 [Nocardioides ginsengisoli]|uniref:Uncharacterized protein n=2 Tax=Actinomycetes TaxID=1760 RepID=A0ABP7U0F3_9ACTN